MYQMIATIFVVISLSHVLMIRGDVSCGDLYFTEDEGEISSPRIPLDSKIAIDCIYNIELALDTKWVKLSWQTFDLVGEMPTCQEAEYVEVYTGCGRNKYKISKFCSSNMDGLPHEIYSKDECMQIKFHSSPSSSKSGKKRGSGFKATYESFSLEYSPFVKTCQTDAEIFQTKSGIVSSPGWPIKYEDYKFSSGVCKWSIEMASQNEMLQINFMDVSLTSNSYLEREDEIKLTGKLSKISKKSIQPFEVYKGTIPPFTVNSESYAVDVAMTLKKGVQTSWAKWVKNERGFILGYVSYKNKEVTIPTTTISAPTTNSQSESSRIIPSPSEETPTLTINLTPTTVNTPPPPQPESDMKVIIKVLASILGVIIFLILCCACAHKVFKCKLSVCCTETKADVTNDNRISYNSFGPPSKYESWIEYNSPHESRNKLQPVKVQLSPQQHLPSAPVWSDEESARYGSSGEYDPNGVFPPSYRQTLRMDNEDTTLL